MDTYHKIQTIFKRDPNNKHKSLLMGEYAIPEFAYLAHNQWNFTEKLNGTCTRVMMTDWGEGFGKVEFGGKTDSSQLHMKLVSHLRETFTVEKLAEVFDSDTCLYGEGVGAGIQKGGGNYYKEQRFVLFDVKVGDWWLRRGDVEDVAEKLGIPVAPVIGRGILADMVFQCREGFTSQWGDFRAEGIVARPATELFTRSGHRIITKLKCKDFPR